MKYKVIKGSDLHKELKTFLAKAKTVMDAARALANEFGAGDLYKDTNFAAGRFAALYFKQKPDGWKHVGQKWKSIFMPLASNKKAWDKIQALPVIQFEEMNKIIGFKHGSFCTGGGISWVNTYGLLEGKKDTFLIEIPSEIKFKPMPGMIEILESEYKSLTK